MFVKNTQFQKIFEHKNILDRFNFKLRGNVKMKTSISKAAKPYKIWKQPRALSRRFVFPSLFLERLHKSCESNAFLHKKSTYNRYIPTKFSLHVYLYHMKTVMQKWQFLVHPLWKKAGNERVDRIGAKI